LLARSELESASLVSRIGRASVPDGAGTIWVRLLETEDIRFPAVNAGRFSPEFRAGNQLISTSSIAAIAWGALGATDAAAGIAFSRRGAAR
jgi:hypothetical protein